MAGATAGRGSFILGHRHVLFRRSTEATGAPARSALYIGQCWGFFPFLLLACTCSFLTLPLTLLAFPVWTGHLERGALQAREK